MQGEHSLHQGDHAVVAGDVGGVGAKWERLINGIKKWRYTLRTTVSPQRHKAHEERTKTKKTKIYPIQNLISDQFGML